VIKATGCMAFLPPKVSIHEKTAVYPTENWIRWYLSRKHDSPQHLVIFSKG
jgi:hypothetical protein